MPEPLLLQSGSRGGTSRSTGLGCLAVVGRLHGVNLTVDQMVHDNLLGLDEVSSGQLLTCAEKAGFRCRKVTLGWQGILDLKKALPSILCLADGSFRVILKIEQREGSPRVVLQGADEAAGTTLMDRAGLEAVWDGPVVLIKRNYEMADEQRPFSLAFVASMIGREKRIARDLLVSAVVMSGLALSPILFWRELSSRVLAYHAINTFVVVAVVMAVLVVFETAFGWLRRHLVNRLTDRIDAKLMTYMFGRLLNLPVDYFESTPLGLTAYKMGQMGRIRAFLTGSVFGVILDAGILIFFLPVMVYLSFTLTAFTVSFGALIFLWIVFMLPRYRKRAQAVEVAEGLRRAYVSQSIAGMRTIKSLALDSRQRHEWDVLTTRVAKLRLAESDVGNAIQTLSLPLERMMATGTFAIGVLFAITQPDVVAVGALLTFNLLAQRVASPLMGLAQTIQQYDEAVSAVELVGDVVNQPEEEGRSGHGVRVPLRGHVEFANVRFQYRGSVQPALRSVTFEVPRGTTLGVMGRSGSGKTTLTRLLQKLHSDYQGLIKIDGVDVREYDVDHLRSSLGVVLQDNYLFSGTIRENIMVAKSDATMDEVVYAARLAGAEEFIDKLPGGYATMIYEGSPNLSGGQKQRVAIARALITNPKILILDEATSALDAESEAIVNANLRRIAEGRTMIVISHRLSSLVTADAILVLDQGEVHDIGRHRELLERCDIYSGLWHRQHAHVEVVGPDRKLLSREAHVA